jgi:hypothetical protein
MPSDGPAVEGVDVDGATGGCYRCRMAAPVSEADREYFRRIGRYKEESHAAAQAAHLALPPLERLRRSFAFSAQWRTRANLTARHDDPSPFYERARALGLYRDGA